jgi:hypothetical protein
MILGFVVADLCTCQSLIVEPYASKRMSCYVQGHRSRSTACLSLRDIEQLLFTQLRQLHFEHSRKLHAACRRCAAASLAELCA